MEAKAYYDSLVELALGLSGHQIVWLKEVQSKIISGHHVNYGENLLFLHRNKLFTSDEADLLILTPKGQAVLAMIKAFDDAN